MYNTVLDKKVEEKTHELRKANEKLKVLARNDSLTEIYNRGYFFELAGKYFDIAKRNGTHIQVLSLDLDYFKDVNDTYGHQAGDIVLKAFTNTVNKHLRESDVFGRIGGEEFCILLQNTSLDGALIFANRLCKSVEALEVEYKGSIIKFTVSIGIADLKDEQSIDELIGKSDKALYKAKENGRNQTQISTF